VRLRDVLARAGVGASAKHLHTFGSDDPPGKVPPFHRSLELAKAMDDCILAYEMNGQPLPRDHGAPLRLVVPGWAGDHWMKWLVRLTVASAPQTGFYMDTAYRWPNKPGEPGVSFKPEEMHPLTELAVKSNITSAPKKVRFDQTSVIRGFAFSGAAEIVKVEVTDDRNKWDVATLDPRRAPHSWRLWSYRWKPTRYLLNQISVRATDSRGVTQPMETVWNQSGYLYNGYHYANVEVSK
jgi:sulfite oxidase